MPLFEITPDCLMPFEPTTFAQAKITERGDLQRLLRAKVDAVCPDAMVIAEEFGDWEESKRRIDLLAVDQSGALVVIELKRTEDGGHMELQALRYAAMVSAMTFAQAVDHYHRFCQRSQGEAAGTIDDAEEALRTFLEEGGGDDEADDGETVEERFGNRVRVVLASAEFGKELTTAVLWLNDQGMDITCVRMRPYRDGTRTVLDIQQIIPLPEAANYQTGLRQKAREERVAKETSRNLTRFDVTVNGVTQFGLPKNRAALAVVHALIAAGATPQKIMAAYPSRSEAITFTSLERTGLKMGEALPCVPGRRREQRWQVPREQVVRGRWRMLRVGRPHLCPA